MQSSGESPSLKSLMHDLKVLDASPIPDMVVTFYENYNLFVLEKNIISDSTPVAEKEAVAHVREAFALLSQSKDHNVNLTAEHVKKMEPTKLEKVKDSLKAAANVFMKGLGIGKKFDRSKYKNKISYRNSIKAAGKSTKGISI
jgi:hypothetical protein